MEIMTSEGFSKDGDLLTFLNNRALLQKKYDISLDISIFKTHRKRHIFKTSNVTFLQRLKLIKHKNLITDTEAGLIMSKLRNVVTSKYIFFLEINLDEAPISIFKRLMLFAHTLCDLEIIFNPKERVNTEQLCLLTRTLAHFEVLKALKVLKNHMIATEGFILFLLETAKMHLTLTVKSTNLLGAIPYSESNVRILNKLLRYQTIFNPEFAPIVNSCYLTIQYIISEAEQVSIKKSIFTRLYHYSTENICKGQSIFSNDYVQFSDVSVLYRSWIDFDDVTVEDLSYSLSACGGCMLEDCDYPDCPKGSLCS